MRARTDENYRVFEFLNKLQKMLGYNSLSGKTSGPNDLEFELDSTIDYPFGKFHQIFVFPLLTINK